VRTSIPTTQIEDPCLMVCALLMNELFQLLLLLATETAAYDEGRPTSHTDFKKDHRMLSPS
jgi:hypothetical protein